MIETGCVHGRFQPFHKEHLDYVVAALEKANFIWIGLTNYDLDSLPITSTPKSRSLQIANPLTFYERIECITVALLEYGISRDRFCFVPFPIENPKKLSQFVSKSATCFTTVREDWNKQKINLLSEEGYSVDVLWEDLSEKVISSTKIRNKILRNEDDWKDMVPAATVKFLQSIDIYQRLQKLNV